MKKYLEFIKENVVNKEIKIRSEKDFHLICHGVEKIFASSANLTSLPELPECLTTLSCRDNNLTSLPKLPESLVHLYCGHNDLTSLPELPEGLTLLWCSKSKLTSLPELPESLIELRCYNNPLEYPIPHKFYCFQDEDWLKELNLKLSSYEHQKKLINEHGIKIMDKYYNHPELINEQIKDENPTYFKVIEYGF
jgi:Leucine-rich repeat (LRR) protein